MTTIKENEFLCDEEIYKSFVHLKDKICEERKKKELVNNNIDNVNFNDDDDNNYDDDGNSYCSYIKEMKKL
ncbi:hypothetical protein PFDG_03876, partial [Plasmodium falciparum Dd2]